MLDDGQGNVTSNVYHLKKGEILPIRGAWSSHPFVYDYAFFFFFFWDLRILFLCSYLSIFLDWRISSFFWGDKNLCWVMWGSMVGGWSFTSINNQYISVNTKKW
jgi:hypothetical protein